jgi:predicted Zn-dependent protease
MKKASILYILFLVVVFSVSAQKLKKSEEIIKEAEPKVNIDSLAQQLAINAGDYNQAITFGYRILAKEPENLTRVFHLAQLYYAAQNYEMSLRFSTILANKDNLNNQRAMELAALNLIGLKANDKAVELYKVMAKEFKSPAYLYEASVLEYQTKKFDDCVATLNMVLKDTIAQNQTIVMSRKNAVEKVIKEEINLIAASLNILGVVSLEKENYTEAKKYFSNALAIQPNFILAENNLKEVVKKEEDAEAKKEEPKKSN